MLYLSEGKGTTGNGRRGGLGEEFVAFLGFDERFVGTGFLEIHEKRRH